MAFKLVAVLALFFLVQVNFSKEHLVQTNCRYYSNSCRTFNDYANDADTYFTSDSYFYFMKGKHHLNVTLFITNVVNLSFVGHESDIILSNGCSIIWTNSFNISWTTLSLMFNEANQNNKSALCFENSPVVHLLNASSSKLHLKFLSRSFLAIRCSIEFENCRFEYGNRSEGGTLYINDSNVTLSGHNYFLGNAVEFGQGLDFGGAVYGLKSHLNFSGNGTFVGNKVGSAIFLRSSHISFVGCFKFHDNKGAISVFDSILTMQGVFYFANNTNCNYNYYSDYYAAGAIYLNDTKCLILGLLNLAGNRVSLNGGAIHAKSSSLTIQSDESANKFGSFNSECLSKSYLRSIIFCNNSAENRGGAIHLEDSNMTLTGSFIFVANKAYRGGGISIPYISNTRIYNPNLIMFQEPLDIGFNANIASGFGGAMYIHIDVYNSYTDSRLCESLYRNYEINKCFFTMKLGVKRFVNLNFTGNKAIAGAGIYGGDIEYCLVKVGNITQRGYQVLQDIIKHSNIKKLYANFEAVKTRYCINGTTPDLYYNYIEIEAQRGQVFNISVTVLGEFHFPVSERVAFTLLSNEDTNSSEVYGEPYNYLTKKGCRILGFRILSDQSIEQLYIHPPQCPYETATLLVTIFLNCPPGFVLTYNTCTCQKVFFQVTGHTDLCDSSTGLIKCPQQDWMKPILDENLTYQGFMWSPNCPAHLCRNDKDNWLDFSSDNVDFLCLEYRTAMLCGACVQNYSLTLSSLKCSKCNGNKYLSLLLVFTLAGVVLIASLLLLHMTVADGTINGLIFYANITNIIRDHIFPQKRLPPNPLTLFISWLNLDLGIPTCFYTGFNYYSYVWLQFVFPFYLWFLVGLIILACKYSSRAMKLFGSNPVAVLATVVLMSYNKLLHTSQQILSYVTVYYSDGTQEKRWKIDPNLLYFQGNHFPLAMFGLLILIVFLIPYVVLMTFGHYLQKYSNKRGLKWLIKIKPILDAYYAPFCKNTCYWVGLTLFVRTCLSITYSTLKNTEHTLILVIVSSVLTGIAVIPWLQHKIYQKRYLNILEGSFILNATVLSIATHQVSQEQNKQQLTLTYTSISIALIEFLVILVFHSWHRLNLKQLYMKYRNSYKFTNAGVSSNSNNEGKPGGIVSTTMVFDIREPLLEDSITEL